MRISRTIVCTAIFTALFSTGIAPTTASASAPIRIYFDGRIVTSDTPPEIVNDRTMVPLRIISETFGSDVSWVDQTKTVTVKSGGLTNTLTIGPPQASFVTKTGKAIIELDAPPYIKNSRTMVPLRYLAESLGLDVGWSDAERAVYINRIQPAPAHGPFDFHAYREMGRFNSGLAAVVNDDNKLGFIDLDGNLVIDYQFDRDVNTTDSSKHDYIPQNAGPYYDDYNIDKYAFNQAGYAHVKKNGEYFFIDKTGKRVEGITAGNPQVSAPELPVLLGVFQEISVDSYGKGLSWLIENKNRGQYIVPLNEWFYEERYDDSQYIKKFYITAPDGRIVYDCTQAVIDIIKPYISGFNLKGFNESAYLTGAEWDPAVGVCYLWQAPNIHANARLRGFWKVDILPTG